jgi:acyl-CoA synthetase (AMP-forming)/AMP-acid ligase II
MIILRAHEVDREIGLLDAAWAREETFAFVSDKSGVDETWLRERLELLPEPLHRRHFVLLTSGTTRTPKLIVGARDRAERLTGVLHELQDAAAVAETVVILPLAYCYAFVNQWLWARRHLRQLTLTTGLIQPDRLCDQLSQARDAALCMVGAQVPMFENYFSGQVFPGIVRLHFAGGRFPQEKLDFLRALMPNAMIFNNYGCAEAMPRLTLRRAESSDLAQDIGRPLPGVELKTDEEGRLLFRSPFRAVAEIDGGSVRRIDDEEWMPTGDMARPLENGHWELLGRANEVFKRYGEKISLPHLMANVLKVWQGTAQFTLATDSMGERGHVLVLAPHASKEQVRELLRMFRELHPRPHWPLHIESVEALPILANGKIDVKALEALKGQIHWRQMI